MYPREVVKQALADNAAAVILAHNHPSGIAEPSQSDLQTWESSYGMTSVPVLDDSGYQLWPYVESDWNIPTIVHIGPGMEVLSVDQGIADPGSWL